MRSTTGLAATLFAALALTGLSAAPASAVAAFDPPPNDFVAGSTVTLSGTKDPGSTLVLRRDGQVVCTASDPDALRWQCADLPTPSGVHTFTGDETLSDASVEPMPPLTLRVLAAPTLDGAGGTVLTTGRFSGSGVPGASIRLQSMGPGGTADHSCPAALPSGFWSCVVDLPNGDYQVRVRQQVDAIGPELSEASAAVTATIDRTAPSAPTVTSPRPGTTSLEALTARGGGERDALLQLFLNGEVACETTVSASGAWECPIRWPGAGTFTLQALQRDRAGNFSPASARIEVRFSPRANPPSASAPGAPPTPDPSTTPKPGATGSPRPDGARADSVPPMTTNWGTPTGFGASLPTAAQLVDRGGWALAPLTGLAYLLLVALPLRAFAVQVVPRLPRRRRRMGLTGRNRDDLDAEAAEHGTRSPVVLSPVLVAAGTLGGAAVIAALSGGIDTEVRYLRLTAAIAAGLVLLNLMGVLLPARLAARAGATRAVVRLLPGILLVALVAALVSRVGGLQPPLLAGVLIAATAAVTARRRVQAGVAVAQTSAVAALALLGWAAHDLLSPSTGFWMTAASETAAAVALGGLGSLLMLLLPVGPLPGRTLYAVSPPAWGAVALVSASVTGAILVAGPAFPMATLTLTAAACAALLMTAVVWVRWVSTAWR